MRRLDDRLGVGGAAELEVEQRHAADGALLDHPGHGPVTALLNEDPRHVGRNAKADVDRIAVAQLLRDAPGDDLGDVELRRLERRQRPKDLARDRRLIGGMRRLQLLWRDHDIIDENAWNDDVVRAQSACRRQPLYLSDDDAAVVANGERLVERAENAALMLVGKVSALVGGRCADDGDLRRDGRKEEPLLSSETDALDDRIGRRLRVHRAALVDRIDKRVHADLRQHARPLRRGLAMDVEQDARGHVICRDRIAGDHLPDLRRLGRGRARRIGPGENTRKAPGLGKVIDSLDAPHVPGGDRMQGGDIARMPLGVEARPDRRQRRVGTSERGRGRDGDDRAVGNETGGVRRGDHLWSGHDCPQTVRSMGVSAPERAAASAEIATLRDLIPSSPVAEGAPRPATASWNRRIERP